jgi:hypothetical protein
MRTAQDVSSDDLDAARARYSTAASAVRRLASALGFWASFLVSDHVTVCTKHVDDDVYIWELVLPLNGSGRSTSNSNDIGNDNGAQNSNGSSSGSGADGSSSSPAAGVIEIRKGAAAINRGRQLLEQTPPLGASSAEATKAASANDFLASPSSQTSINDIGSSNFSSSSSSDHSGAQSGPQQQQQQQQHQGWLGPPGFPEGSTIHLLLREDHNSDNTISSRADAGRGSTTSINSSTPIWSCALHEACVKELVAGSGEGDGENSSSSSLITSATYPLLFWGDGSTFHPQSGSKEEEGSAEDGSDDSHYSDSDEVGGDEEVREKDPSPEAGGGSMLLGGAAAKAASVPTTMRERAVYIPLRLSYEDRKVPPVLVFLIGLQSSLGHVQLSRCCVAVLSPREGIAAKNTFKGNCVCKQMNHYNIAHSCIYCP